MRDGRIGWTRMVTEGRQSCGFLFREGDEAAEAVANFSSSEGKNALLTGERSQVEHAIVDSAFGLGMKQSREPGISTLRTEKPNDSG